MFWPSAFDAPTTSSSSRSTPTSWRSVGYTFAIAALILTTATLRDERDSGTLPYIYMRPIARVNMAAQSIAAGTAAALVIGVGGWIASAVALLAVGAICRRQSRRCPCSWRRLSVTPPFVPLGYLVPRALLVGLGYILVVETILALRLRVWPRSRSGGSLSIYAGLEDGFGEVARQAMTPVTPGVGGRDQAGGRPRHRAGGPHLGPAQAGRAAEILQ